MRRRLAALLLILLASLPSAASAQSDGDAARALLASLNAWRVQNNLWPLTPNDTLAAVAVAQASYVLSLPAVPEGADIHLGPGGKGPQQRAHADPFDWPVYGREDRADVTEIAYEGASPQRAVGFWQGSDVHRTAALNPAYREVGVAALPDRYGYLYVVVLGSRPNVLPTLLDPASGTLYLTNETYRWAAGGPWLTNATQVQIFDGEGKPLGVAQPWQRTIQLPTGAGDQWFVLYSNGAEQVISEVRGSASYAVLPTTLALVAAPSAAPAPIVIAAAPSLTPGPGAAVAQVSRPTATAFPTTTPIPTATDAPLAASDHPTATPVPSATPLAPSSTPVPAAAPDLTILYDSRSLAIINTSIGPVDLAQLALVQGTFSLPAARWQQYLSGSLNAIPARDCLQAWSSGESADLPAPSGCRYVRGVTYLGGPVMFWTQGPFDVQWSGRALVTCAVGAGRCLVDLP